MKACSVIIKQTVILIFLLALASCTGAKGAAENSAASLYSDGLRSYQKGRYVTAVEKLKTVMEEYPLSEEAVNAELALADTYYDSEEYEDAIVYYTDFVSLHPSHPNAPYAKFQKGMSYVRQISTIDRDQTPTKKALFAFQDLISMYPSGPYTEKAKEMLSFLKRRLAERELYIANFYFKSKNYRGALGRYAEILKEYPDVGLTDKTLYYIGETYIQLGEKDLARDVFSDLVASYPDSPFAKDAKGKLKSI